MRVSSIVFRGFGCNWTAVMLVWTAIRSFGGRMHDSVVYKTGEIVCISSRKYTHKNSEQQNQILLCVVGTNRLFVAVC